MLLVPQLSIYSPQHSGVTHVALRYQGKWYTAPENGQRHRVWLADLAADAVTSVTLHLNYINPFGEEHKFIYTYPFNRLQVRPDPDHPTVDLEGDYAFRGSVTITHHDMTLTDHKHATSLFLLPDVHLNPQNNRYRITKGALAAQALFEHLPIRKLPKGTRYAQMLDRGIGRHTPYTRLLAVTPDPTGGRYPNEYPRTHVVEMHTTYVTLI